MKKAVAFLLSTILLCSLVLYVAPVASAAWSTNYSLSGNQAQDIVNVAVAQENKTGSELGYSSSWCSYFVYDCAQKADIPSSMIPRQGYASSLYRVMTQNGTEGHYFTDVISQIPNWTGGNGGGMSSNYDTQYSTGILSSNWTPQVGDIVFFTYTAYSTISHVAIVQKPFQADGTNKITVVHGNWSSKVTVGTTMPRGALQKMGTYTYAICAYVRPNYNGSSGSGPSTLSINPTVYPTGVIPAGKSFSLEGSVTSNYPITEFSGVVFNSAGGVALDEVTMYPNSYSVNIKNSAVDLGLKFGTLQDEMSYILCYTAKDASGNVVEWPSDWAGYWFWVGSVGEHTHDKGSFEFYEAAHPHCNCYKCSYCGEIWRDTSSSNEMDNCYYCQKPGKPALKNFSTSYGSGSTITFNWDSVEKATHYNLYIDKQNADGSWDQFYKIYHYAESGMTESLEEGIYRVMLQATNENCAGEDGTGWAYTNGDYITFYVGDLPEIFQSYSLSDVPGSDISIFEFYSSVCGSKYFQNLQFNVNFNSGGSPLTSVKVSVLQKQTLWFGLPTYVTVQNFEINPQAQGLDNYCFRNEGRAIKLDELEVGTYKIRYQATNTYGTKAVERNFKVFSVPDPMPTITSDRELIEIDNIFVQSYSPLILYKTNATNGEYNFEVETIPATGSRFTARIGNVYQDRYELYGDYRPLERGPHSGLIFAQIRKGIDGDTWTAILVDYVAIPVIAHYYQSEVHEPTCTAEGYTSYTCQDCGKTIRQDVVEALGHDWDQGTVVKPATITETGLISYKCSRCGGTKTEVIPKLEGPANPFVDVAEGKYYYGAVLWAYYHDPQITGGTDATHFSPGKNCTREQIVSFLWKAYGAEEPTMTFNPFSDVKESKYYYKAVLWAVQNGITGGSGDGKFGVGKSCTREQAVSFLWKAAGAPEPKGTDCPFEDVKPEKYYYKAVLWAVENGVTGGTSATKFGVGKVCTRGQIVTFLYKALGENG